MSPHLGGLLPSGKAARALVAATLVSTSGDGLYIAASALFFVRALHLPISQVGLGLTLAGIVGLPAGIAAGRLADHHGARQVTIALLLLQALAISAYTLVNTFPLFVIVAAVALASMQGSAAAQAALIPTATAEPVKLRAYLHAVTNLGMTLGAACAGVVIAANTAAAYDALMLTDAATFLIAAALMLLVPRIPPSPRAPEHHAWAPLKDTPYLTITALNGLLCLQFVVLTFALPLWIVTHTTAPRWLISPLLLINTSLIVTLQVRFARHATTIPTAATSLKRSGWLLALAMTLYATAAHTTYWPAIVLLTLAALTHTIGELLQTSGAFSLSYNLAQPHAIGQYQGIFGLGIGTSRITAPLILTLLCLDLGTTGWLILATAFILTATAIPHATRHAQTVRAHTNTLTTNQSHT